MSRPALELAAIFRNHGPAYREKHSLPREHLRVMRAVEICRTAELGGHADRCGQCGHTRISYNSCRNRHCPKCQSLARARWVAARQVELLPVEYFHVVFTVPEQIAAIAYYNPRTVYDILFQATAETLATIARDPKHLGAEMGFFAVLHTWGQNLLHHPHLHCVVPGGGLSPDGQRWIACSPGFFLPVRVLSRLFRRLFLEWLRSAFAKGELQFFSDLSRLCEPAAFDAYLTPLRNAVWVVYAKAPFGGPPQVIEYLGRYTHRVALSNQRLLEDKDEKITFQWKDYGSNDPQKSRRMTLDSNEFLRRFLMHVLPPGFQRIRFFGFLANRHRKTKLAKCRKLLLGPMAELLPTIPDHRDRHEELTGPSIRQCPECGTGEMLRVLTVLPGQCFDST